MTERTWYRAKMTGHGQGLVIDEKTGENIAVTFKEENASLISSAPELLEACKKAELFLLASNPKEDFCNIKDYLKLDTILQHAIAKAEKGE